MPLDITALLHTPPLPVTRLGWGTGLNTSRERFTAHSLDATSCRTLEGPFAPNKVAVPFEQCLRFEQENNLTKSSATGGRHRGQLSSEDEEGELLPAGNAWRAWLCALENAELLAEEQDFDILVMVSLSAQSDEVEEDREDVCYKEKGHADWRCRDRAAQRKQTMCGALKSLWRPSDAVSAPYGVGVAGIMPRGEIASENEPCAAHGKGSGGYRWLTSSRRPSHMMVVTCLSFG